MSEKEAIDTWAIVDLFGHQQIAGRVTEQAIGSESMLRVDVPAVPGREAFTRFYGVKAVYSLTPVSEEIARRAVDRLRETPITVYGLALPAGDSTEMRRQRAMMAPPCQGGFGAGEESGDEDGPYDWSGDEDEDEDDLDGRGDEQELMF